MPQLTANGIRIAYQRSGTGENVLMIMGSGAAGHVWSTYQTPALHRAGYHTITFNNRGIPPTDAPEGRYTLDQMVADTRGLIEALGVGPCRIVGYSLGAMIAQELAVKWPGLVRSAVLVATRARPDVLRRAQMAADRALQESGLKLPRNYDAVTTAMQMLSPATLNNDAVVSSWLEVLELAGDTGATGQAFVDLSTDRRTLLRTVTAPCRVIAFSDDLIAPPHLGAEVAEAMPNSDYVEISQCGHLGHLERPDEVNAAIIEFLDKY
ncbi:alpha/beta hydrolase [Micromonospora aurantiaca]|uniref:alpha/beta fold hydrolase n=1 Tax=Micromonospora aurantiaca (nom. illeg.) TaxID=47850 RepID=UPI0033A1F71E